MQRRAAAIYAAFFILVAVASYGMIATAQTPHVDLQNPAFELGQGDEFTVGDQTYAVSAIDAEIQGGGSHGGAATLSRSGELQWTNESARYTVTWENGSTITFEGTDYDVVVPNASDRTDVRLVEAIDRAAILRNDTAADNETITRDGQEFVVITEDGSSRLVPADDYFPEPATRTFSEGESVAIDGNETTLASVTADGATFEWFAPQTVTEGVADESNVTLSGETYLATFPDNSTMVLTQDYEEFNGEKAEIAAFERHKTGFWGVTAVSLATAVLLVGLAYLPSRY